MEINSASIKNMIMFNRDKDLIDLLNSGWNPNAEGGWPIRLAARYGCCFTVKILIQYGANPHLVSEIGATTLELAVFSGKHWDSDRWKFLLSCSDSSELANGAAVAIIFNITAALVKIIKTGRCNGQIETTLTGKTVEQLARGFKMTHLLYNPSIPSTSNNRQTGDYGYSQRISRPTRSEDRNSLMPQSTTRNLSPSVARFFQQTAAQPSLLSPRTPTADNSSPTSAHLTNQN